MLKFRVESGIKENMDIILPPEIEYVLGKLTENGYEACVVGGCVRDSLLGEVPKDWDVCTSAIPEEIISCFPGEKTLDVGLKHGTVTVITGDAAVEVTTYRVDGEYSDHRRPDHVIFSRSLEEDLSRRDLTINAIAYRPDAGLIDPHGGRDDLEKGIIRTVGQPEKRFNEDALRILRALRIASELGFNLERETERAIYELADTCSYVAAERKGAEFRRIVLGQSAGPVLSRYGPVIARALGCRIPPAEPAVLAAVGAAGPALPPRLALVFSPAGGPALEEALRELKFDSATVRETAALADLLQKLEAEEDGITPGAPVRAERDEDAAGEELRERSVRIRFLVRDFGIGTVRNAFRVRIALGRAGAESDLCELDRLSNAGVCMTIRDLAVSGEDLLNAGFKPGPFVGRMLDELLTSVITGELENDREALLDRVRYRASLMSGTL